MKLKQFQRDDLARAALHDGLILGLDAGLGKTICAYVWPILKVGLLRRNGKPVRPICPAEPVLLIATGDLHDQIISEGLTHFGTAPTILDAQQTFLRLSTLSAAGRRELPPGYYLTTYTQLSRNGVTPFPELDRANSARMLKTLNLSPAAVDEFFAQRGHHYEKHYTRLHATPADSLPKLHSQWFKLRRQANEWLRHELDEAYDLLKDFCPTSSARPPRPISMADLEPDQRTAVTAHFVTHKHAEFSHNLGQSRSLTHAATHSLTPHSALRTPHFIKCIYSPSLADLCQDSFAVVVADEGTKIKGEDTLIGKSTRQMNPKYRLPMTATPIKNRLPDVFRLAHWATGAHHLAHPRFPFGDGGRDTFAEEFSVSERNLSAEERSENGRRFVKLTPQVCSIHRLWKLLCPIILRRRKKDCGEALVNKTRHVVRVPMGQAQAAVYKFHLEADYKDKNDRPAIGAKLQALRIAASNPASLLLTRPASDTKTQGEPRSLHAHIPKLASALALVEEVLDRREQVIVFSAFHDSLDALSAHLREAGVKHVVLDGRSSPAKRGAAAKEFKKGPAGGGLPVMLAGVECMSEGHSFHLCNNVILLCYSWAYDKFAQAIDRIYRLNSPKDVTVYVIICEGSIDRKLEAMIQEKGDAAELVLDGHLLGEDATEVNLAELLQIAEKEFATIAAGGTIEERDLENEWPILRAQLAEAMRLWQRPAIGAAGLKWDARAPTPVLALAPGLSAPDLSAAPPFAHLPLWRRVFRVGAREALRAEVAVESPD
jgi:hypothetical protein